jgi:hypothetical protein
MCSKTSGRGCWKHQLPIESTINFLLPLGGWHNGDFLPLVLDATIRARVATQILLQRKREDSTIN